MQDKMPKFVRASQSKPIAGTVLCDDHDRLTRVGVRPQGESVKLLMRVGDGENEHAVSLKLINQVGYRRVGWKSQSCSSDSRGLYGVFPLKARQVQGYGLDLVG